MSSDHRPLPDNHFRLDGRLTVEDAATGIVADVTVSGHHVEGDGCASAWLELTRDGEHHGAGADKPYRVNVGGFLFRDLTDALWGPEPAVHTREPLTLSGEATTSVDGKPAVSHRITERMDAAGRVVVMVEGPKGRVLEEMLDEPAIAMYLHRKRHLIEQLAWRDEPRPVRSADSPSALRKTDDGWVRCPLYHYPVDRCTQGLCDESGLVHPAAITARLGPWITLQAAQAELDRIPAAWGAEVVTTPYWSVADAALLSGTSEDGRLEGLEIRLRGIGWGRSYTTPGDLPDGPTIDLWPTNASHHMPVDVDPDRPVEWCAHLPGDSVHGSVDTVAEALDLAVASITGRLGNGLARAA